VVKIEGISHFAGLPNVVGKDMIDGALHVLENAGFYAIPPEDAGGSILPPDANAIPISISNTRFPPSVAPGAGSGIVLYATLTSGAIIGGSALGAKGISATRVGEDAAKELIRNLRNGGVVDEWLQDQVILFMALAKGTSQINIG
jgi:RNA 3'-terminal phosphate cyclase (ATP)